MNRVPVMKFCPPLHPTPALNDVEGASRAKARFSLAGKRAVGKNLPNPHVYASRRNAYPT